MRRFAMKAALLALVCGAYIAGMATHLVPVNVPTQAGLVALVFVFALWAEREQYRAEQNERAARQAHQLLRDTRDAMKDDYQKGLEDAQ